MDGTILRRRYLPAAIGVSVLIHALFFMPLFSSDVIKNLATAPTINTRIVLTQIQAKRPEAQKSVASKQRINEPQINQSSSKTSKKKPDAIKQAQKRNQQVLASLHKSPHLQVDKQVEQETVPVSDPTKKTEADSKSASELMLSSEDSNVQDTNISSEQNAPHEVAAKSVAPIVGTMANGHVKQDYLSLLLARIKLHKFYPHIARRRNLQAKINVSFWLLSSGKLSGIEIDGGPKPLREATLKAINDALPLPAPPSTITFPVLISFNMDYRLK